MKSDGRITYTDLYRSYHRRESWRGLLHPLAALILIGTFAALVMMGLGCLRAFLAIDRPVRVTGFPSIDRGLYPDAPVEPVEKMNSL